MWLPHIHRLIEETNMDHLNCDLPMAIFMIKLLFTRIKFDNFANLQTYLDYIESSRSIELKYFIQSTIKEEINLECVLKEKEIAAEIEKIDEMFNDFADKLEEDQNLFSKFKPIMKDSLHDLKLN